MSLLKVDDLDEEDLNLFDHYFLKKAEEASSGKHKSIHLLEDTKNNPIDILEDESDSITSKPSRLSRIEE